MGLFIIGLIIGFLIGNLIMALFSSIILKHYLDKNDLW